MALFTVTAVVDGDTFEVAPGCQWNGQQGTRVRPAGYDAPELCQFGGVTAHRKLSGLILGGSVELGRAYRIDHGRLVCDVVFSGRNLADFFPEYR